LISIGNLSLQKQLSGTSIREHRQRLGLKQAELAERVGISASYFNQIEHNRRRIGGKLFSNIAAALGVEPSVLAEGGDARLTDSLRDAQLSEPNLTGVYDAAEVFSGRFPAWARLLAVRHTRVQKLEQLTEAMTDRLANDGQLADALHELLSTVTAIRSSASILEDEPKLEPAWRQRFQRNIIEDSARLSRGAQALVDYLNKSAGTATGASLPPEEVEQFLTDNAYHFPQLEEEGASAIKSIAAASTRLKSRPARRMAEVYLTVYQRDAAKLPMPALKAALRRHGLDPIAIARDIGVDLATTLRRLASVPEQVLPSPVGLFIADASGTLVLKKQVKGFSMPLFSGACALLPLFLATSQPLRPIRRYLQQSGRDRSTILTYTIATPTEDMGLDDNLVLQSHMLVIPQPPGLEDTTNEAIALVGRTCRLCHVERCSARREPARMDGGLIEKDG
jgi:XRE family transcriptional regulator, fatty acid utilization regulator